MGDYDRVGEGVVGLIFYMFIGLVIFVPLGIWKLVEIIIYLNHHLHLVFL